mgnify:FL=1
MTLTPAQRLCLQAMDAAPRLPRDIGRRMGRRRAPSEPFLRGLCTTGLAHAELRDWFTANWTVEANGYALTSRGVLWQQRGGSE